MSRASEMLAEARAAQVVAHARHEAKEFGVDPAAWRRLWEMVDSESMARLVVDKVRASREQERGIVAVLTSLLADSVAINKETRERFEDYVRGAPVPAMFVPLPDPGAGGTK